jgi:hypothetical protein
MQTLFDQPTTLPHNGTETSKAAAKRQSMGKVDRDLRDIRRAFVGRGDQGFTREELSEATGINPNSINPRTNFLMKTGELVPKIDAEGNRVKRKTTSGSPAQVLVYSWNATHEEQARP